MSEDRMDHMDRGDGGGRIMRCSFCGRTQQEVHQLIGNNDLLICDECLRLCLEMIDYDLVPAEPVAEPESTIDKDSLLENLPTPAELYEELSKYVIGQEDAKRTLSVAVYNHYKRIGMEGREEGTHERIGNEAESDSDSDVEIAKSNVLLLGPTGSGKTLLAQTLARILKVPFAIADATALTEAGYVGEDVENILLKIVTAADFDIERAQIGIIYVDEIDKVARKAENVSITRDVSGEGVQQALLKIVEGTDAAVPPQGGRKHPQQELIHIDTTNILFILGGAFVGLDRIIGDRVGKNGIGFTSEERGSNQREGNELLSQVLPEDLVKFGMIPEFIGRIPVICALEELSEEGLVRILTEPRNALVRQYSKLFEFDGAKLTFTDKALHEIAREAMEHGTGARGLRAICERVLMDTMYELPSRDDVIEVIVTPEAARGEQPPTLVTKIQGLAGVDGDSGELPGISSHAEDLNEPKGKTQAPPKSA